MKTLISKLLFIILLALPCSAWAAQVTLTWDAPTKNVDNTPISYFEGQYRIYYGTSSGNYTNIVDWTDASATVVKTVTGLSNSAPLYFVATAINTLGNESGYSNEVSKNPSDATILIYPSPPGFFLR